VKKEGDEEVGATEVSAGKLVSDLGDKRKGKKYREK